MSFFQKRNISERCYVLILISIALITLIALVRAVNKPSSAVILSTNVNAASSPSATVGARHNEMAVEKIVEVKSPLESMENSGIDYPLLQSLLNQIQFDEKNNLLLQTDARRQLDAAIALIGFERSSYELTLLRDAIEAYLPYEKGRQVSDLLARYYEYKLTESDYMSARAAESPAESINNYTALREMRRSYFGDDLSTQLFAEENRYMDYTLGLMMLDNDKTLSSEQRQQKMEALQKNYASPTDSPAE